MSAVETVSEQRCFGGVQGFYSHISDACGGPMRFAVYLPPAAEHGPVPVLYFLAGLTCTAETFTTKAGAQRVAAELGIALVMPDTSPRETGLPGATGDWEFGEGAGFYLDATEEPWASRFRMYTYVVDELPRVLSERFALDMGRQGIFGHSMGGHGALTVALRNPGRYRSVSAFAPIVAPASVPWGEKAFPRYLGNDRKAWAKYDATALVAAGAHFDGRILIDQGEADGFLVGQLQPQRFEAACEDARQKLELRMHPGYDHSYYFIQSFVEDHLRHHAKALSA
ncbi:S-formylglutathione hydrolase [Xanthomonas sp. NCPPB 2632]|jgi:S-formylglutathione hydrolase|uniref:S-formylglutathione hydrolase n=1 Tax=Xanthomonas sp. NCPPB 2632 TaxID=3240912 RepID=UPI003518F6B3